MGFLLYPSKYTDHTIAKSGWKEGKGDILAEVSASASKYDMDMGCLLYTSPGAEGRQVDVKDWKKLDLPHDWSIFFDFDHNSPAQNEGGQLNGGDAWYRKTFRLDDKDLDKKVRLEFGGVYMDSKVYVNGQFVGHYPCLLYTSSFLCSVTIRLQK